MKIGWWIVGSVVFLVACASETASRKTVSASHPVEKPIPVVESHRDGTIHRQQLRVVLDGGLGRFLQGVRTEPYIVHNKFKGFRILELYPREPVFQGVSPKVGDVVTQINGQPIGRPEQALKVWDSLRVASELRIDYLREGAAHEARYRIVE